MPRDSSKKRKRDSSTSHQNDAEAPSTPGVDTSKPTAVFQPSRGRTNTLSVAIPGSIIANAQTHDLKTALAGTLARALAVFCVDEVIVFDDGPVEPPQYHHDPYKAQLAKQDEASGYTAFSDPGDFLYHILNYLETPPYLRRVLFPHHPNLRTAGALLSLDMPHHLKAEEWCQYREGVTLDGPSMNGHSGYSAEDAQEPPTKIKKNKKTPQSNGTTSIITLANAGIPNPIHIPAAIPPNTRVTLRFDSLEPPASIYDTLAATPVAPEAPREEAGYYWGFTTRRAASLSAVFTEAPWEGGYDFAVGTSERGVALPELLASYAEPAHTHENSRGDSDGEDGASQGLGQPRWRHPLLVFGGVAGLERALANDAALRERGVVEVSDVFDAWVNLVPGQGSRTIRTEEAVWCGLMGLRALFR